MIRRFVQAVMALFRGRAPVRYGESWWERQRRQYSAYWTKRARVFRGWSKASKVDEMARFPSVGQWAKARGLVKK